MKMMMALSMMFGSAALVLSSQAFAEGADIPECAGPIAACEKAGFKPGDHKKTGKGLWVDCIGARARDKEVAGVAFSKEEAKTCADAKKAKHQAKKH